MFGRIGNLICISLRDNKSNEFKQTKELRPGRNPNDRPCPYIVKRRRLQRLFLYKIRNARDFHSITRNKIHLE